MTSFSEALRQARRRRDAMTLTGAPADINDQIRRLASCGPNIVAAEADVPQDTTPAPERYAAGSGDGGKGSPSEHEADMNALLRREWRRR